MTLERGSEQATSDPVFTPAGTVRSVAGILSALGVSGRRRFEQKRAVAHAWSLPSVRVLLEPLEIELREAGLLD